MAKEDIKINMIKDITEYGYLNINDYFDKNKKILFSNINYPIIMFPTTGRFFRDGQFGTLQNGTIKKHNHIIEGHTHNVMLPKSHKANHVADLGETLDVLKPLVDFKAYVKSKQPSPGMIFLDGHIGLL